MQQELIDKINPKVDKWFSDTENLATLLSTASYGNDWFMFDAPSKEECEFFIQNYAEQKKYLCIEDEWAEILLGGGMITIIDTEENCPHTLNIDMLLLGASKLLDEHPMVMARIFAKKDDLTDADALIQYALFGEWIYG